MEFNNTPYGNYEMLSIDGNFLAFTSLKRRKWYMDRGLADIIDEKTYQLNFVTKGDDERSEFYKVALENICVVCGTDEELTKHHVVPSQYRKLLPIEYKGRNSFDVVSICDTCHNEYEREAEKLKEELLERYGLTNYIKSIYRVRRAYNILKYHSENYDPEFLIEMKVDLREFFNDTIENILAKDNIEFENVSAKLMNKVDDIDEFVIMWRKHFLDVANPQHIHQKWIDNVETV